MALVAWDLERFAQRTRAADRIVALEALTRSHLRRLLVVSVLGLGLGAIALGAELPIGFGPVLLLGALAILGLSRAIRWLQRADE
jgi:hypothetical protein